MLRFLLFTLLIGLSTVLLAQPAYRLQETLFIENEAATDGAMIYIKLPLESETVAVSQLEFSTPPGTYPQNNTRAEYSWQANALAGDSLHLSYRVRALPTPAWDSDSLGRNFAWPPIEAGESEPTYVLPPLIAADVSKTELRTLDRGDTSVADIDRLLLRFQRRIKLARSLDDFDYAQPLLKDFHDRLTTPRRKHLLASLMLQYMGIPHRVVAGKIVSYDEVRENELWLELAVDGQWQRVYFGDGIDRSYWEPPFDPDQFLACTYDWRDLTLEVINAPGKPPVASSIATTAKNLVFDFWDRKNEAIISKDFPLALSNIDSVLAYMPTSITALSEKGLIHAEAGRPTEGLPYLQRALQNAATPADQSIAFVQLAKYYSMQEMGDEAVKSLARAQEIYPVNFSVLQNDHRFTYLLNNQDLIRKLDFYLTQGLQSDGY